MKIALLSFEFPPETGFGGIGTYTWYQARALVRLGHQVHVIAGATHTLPLQTTEQEGIQVHRYRAHDLWMFCAGLFRRIGYHWTRQRLENAWCMYRSLKELHRQHGFDVVEMPECGAEGALLNWLIDIPAIVRFHSPSRLIMPFYDVPRGDIVLCSWVERLAIRGATAFTSCSSFLAEEVRVKIGVNKRIAVIPNGIDLPFFDQGPVADIIDLYGLPEGKVTILFAGRMEPRKGIQLCASIVEAVLSKHDVTFVFAGEDLFGYVQQELLPQLQTKQLKGSIRYLGKLNLSQMHACTRAVHIHLLPSLWENCPYACLESMASGLAIVSSDQGGMPELIQHGHNGLLATTGSAESFTTALLSLIEDPELRARIGRAARQSVLENYTDSQIACRTEAIYHSARTEGEAD